MSTLNPISTLERVASGLFCLALVHTFSVKIFQGWALRFPRRSWAALFLRALGEVELAFGFWAIVLLVTMFFLQGPGEVLRYVAETSFTEPVFVLVSMTIASTQPVIDFAKAIIQWIAESLPLSGRDREIAYFWVTLVVGSLLGSLITEPAAMTVTAMILKDRLYSKGCSENLKYVTLGLLFVGVSIGGVLTPYASPPVLMVADTWNWDLSFMMRSFGWKAALAIVLSVSWASLLFKAEFKRLSSQSAQKPSTSYSPGVVRGVQLAFLIAVVALNHYPLLFLAVFFGFLVWVRLTSRFQTPLKLQQSLGVAFFLAGLVLLADLQKWWLEPLLASLKPGPLFLGTSLLTAVTDNATLTFLGSRISNLSDDLKYFLIAGAVAGGGMTVVANAPNPVGFAILSESFGPEGISASRLFLAALVPTAIAMACFWCL